MSGRSPPWDPLVKSSQHFPRPPRILLSQFLLVLVFCFFNICVSNVNKQSQAGPVEAFPTNESILPGTGARPARPHRAPGGRLWVTSGKWPAQIKQPKTNKRNPSWSDIQGMRPQAWRSPGCLRELAPAGRGEGERKRVRGAEVSHGLISGTTFRPFCRIPSLRSHRRGLADALGEGATKAPGDQEAFSEWRVTHAVRHSPRLTGLAPPCPWAPAGHLHFQRIDGRQTRVVSGGRTPYPGISNLQDLFVRPISSRKNCISFL